MGFDALTGQKELKARLGKALFDLPGHAFIFVGPKGMGKFSFAREFAKGLLCHNPDINGGCGICKSCVCFREGTHPDYKEVLLRGKDKTIKTDNVRKILIGDIGLMPQISKRKVYFLSATDLNEQSQNVILKTLEEPPDYAVIILSAYSIQNVLPTVLSRSIPVIFERYDLPDVMKILNSKGFHDNKATSFFAQLSDGIPGSALQFLENSDLSELREVVIKHITGLPKARKSDILLEYFAFYDDNKAVIEELLLILNSWLRDSLIYLSTGVTDKLINSDYSEQIMGFCHKNNLKIRNLLNCIQISEKARTALEMNAGFEICISNMLLMLRKELTDA